MLFFFCSIFPPRLYFVLVVDQVAQNMAKLHFMKACTLIPENTKRQLISLQTGSSRASGKEYWADGLRVLGIVEHKGILRFKSNISKENLSSN